MTFEPATFALMQSDSDTPRFTHLGPDGQARMVDVSEKPVTQRSARASSLLQTTTEIAQRIEAMSLPKGDIIAVCRLAGIQAAKRTSELIPLAHPVPLSFVDINVTIDVPAGTVRFECEAKTAAGTGVEIEAMVAASIAALTCYDMIKAVDRSATVTDVQVCEKRGGRSGVFVRSESRGRLEAEPEGRS